MNTYMGNGDEQTEEAQEDRVNRLTVGVSSATTATRSQTTPLRRKKNTGESRVW